MTTTAIESCPASAVVKNYYGPTEVTIDSAGKRFNHAKIDGLSFIGTPLQNVLCCVATPEKLVLQPAGIYGELLLGGVQVSRGYVNRPALTAEKFIASPWPDLDPTGRGVAYRSGDSCRWTASAELDFAGRIDFQVKLRGLRIELGEVEHALRALEGVEEAVALVRGAGVDARLVAYVSPVAAAASELRSALRQTLPAYMVPSVLVGVAEWPRTSSGKLDRQQLPAPSIDEGAASGEMV